MTTALWCVFIAGLLPYAAALIAKAGAPGFDNNDPRAWLARQQGYRARANAAQQNSFEAFAFFAAAVLVAHASRGQQAQVDMLAMVFVAARVLYLAVYLAGWGAIRSLVWAVGIIATVWIFLTPAVPR
ncbi:MAG: MAPEG family protein [Pseudomonadota bacterium]